MPENAWMWSFYAESLFGKGFPGGNHSPKPPEAKKQDNQNKADPLCNAQERQHVQKHLSHSRDAAAGSGDLV